MQHTFVLLNFARPLNNVSALQLFQLLRFSAFLITGIILAKEGVDLKVIGIYETLMYLSGAFSFFWINALLNSLLAAYPSHLEKKKYLFNAASLIFIFSIVVFIFLNVFASQVFHFFNQGIAPYYRLFTWFLLLNNPGYLIEYIYLLQEKPKRLLTYGIVLIIITPAAAALPLWLGYDLKVSITLLMLFAGIKLVWVIGLLLSYAEIKIKRDYITGHLLLALPLMLGFLMSGSADYIDGWMVSHFFGAKNFAVFRYGAKEFPLSLLLANAASTALIPLLSKPDELDAGMEVLKQKSKTLMHFLFPLSIVLTIMSHYLYPIVFNNNFSGSAAIFNIYALLVMSRLVFPQTIVMALKKTKVLFVISVIEIAINVSASYLLMKHYGILGIAYGTVIAFFGEKLLLIIYLSRTEKIEAGKYIPIKVWTVYCVAITVIFIIINYYTPVSLQ